MICCVPSLDLNSPYLWIYLFLFLCIYVFVPHAYSGTQSREEGSGLLELELTDDFELAYGYWELNLSSLEEQ